MQWIFLSKGLATVVDDSDYEELRQYRWYALKGSTAYYAARKNVRGLYPRVVLMHRFLLDAPDGLEVDHIDGDSLNNTRANLRLATKLQNSANRRVFLPDGKVKRMRGVRPRFGKWIAEIKINGKTKQLGTFDAKEEAMLAYDVAAWQQFGEFATLNFPEKVK